jgi:hypothetical protein
VIKSLSARNRLSLIPRTMIRCSGRRNGPNLSRCSTMRSARPCPIPGSVSNSFAEAVLMLMSVCAAVVDRCSFAYSRVTTWRARLTHPETPKISEIDKSAARIAGHVIESASRDTARKQALLEAGNICGNQAKSNRKLRQERHCNRGVYAAPNGAQGII